MEYMVPPGLEYLTQLDQVLVKQVLEVFEICTGCEMNNKYMLKNSMGQEFMTAREDTNCCTRQCCGPMRCFEMGLFDGNEQEVIHLSRPVASTSCCCPCCLQRMEVFSPPGTLIGSIHQEWSFCAPFSAKFTVRNAGGDAVFKIEGPVCPCSCGSDVDFKVISEGSSMEVGKIYKQWRGLCAEALTDMDNFGISFPMNLDVRMKALLIGALFLIDFAFFEHSQ